MLGGGREYFLPKSEGGARQDGRNLLQEAADAGVTVATTLAQFNGISKMPTLGLFSVGHVRNSLSSGFWIPPLTAVHAFLNVCNSSTIQSTKTWNNPHSPK